jgi:hypothetical protein
VVDREVTIRALRDELVDLEDRKSDIGYFWPIFWAAAGTGVVGGGAALSGTSIAWGKSALMIGGTVVAAAATTWLLVRIARAISLSSQIDTKQDQLSALQAQRL